MPSRGKRDTQKVVLPIPRPASAPQIASDTPPAKPSIFATIFQKLFGKPTPVKFAYAATDEGGLGVDQAAGARYDQWTAVYDISAHIVYMPDGTQLEAHSGLGSWLDDPNHADEKMRGVTPPECLQSWTERRALPRGTCTAADSPRRGENVWPGWSPRPQLSAWAEWRFKWLRVYPEL
jgi:hypothetical protein